VDRTASLQKKKYSIYINGAAHRLVWILNVQKKVIFVTKRFLLDFSLFRWERDTIKSTRM